LEKSSEAKQKMMYSIVKGMTGAQIKNLAEICASYAASNAIEKITFDVLKKVKEIIKDTLKDVDEFISRRSKIRLVKGAYAEGDLNKLETQGQMKIFAEQFLFHGNGLAIATIRDERLIDDICYFLIEQGMPKNRFIIQTLYGVSDNLKNKWRDEGFRVEVYVPIGPWHKALPYIWRRIKEILKKY